MHLIDCAGIQSRQKPSQLQLRPIHRSIILTHWCLVTQYGDIDLGQLWRRWWLVAWRHQGITWTNVDFSVVRSSGNQLRAFSRKILLLSMAEFRLKITSLKLHFPRANELNIEEERRLHIDISYHRNKSFLHKISYIIWARLIWFLIFHQVFYFKLYLIQHILKEMCICVLENLSYGQLLTEPFLV